MDNKKIIYVDIDGTICENRDDLRQEPGKENAEYEDCKPYYDRIQIINDLYDQGHEIVYWTARGVYSGVDYTELTQRQLNEWKVKHSQLKVGGKPHFDMYICDKSYNAASFFHAKSKGLP